MHNNYGPLMQSVDVDNDWKLITLWIGGNDLCRYCNDKVAIYIKMIVM